MRHAMFNVGDEVVCVKGEKNFLKEGNIFIISATYYCPVEDEFYVGVDNSTSADWLQERFELVAKSKEQPATVSKNELSHAQYIRSCVDALNKAVAEAQQQGLDVCVRVEHNNVSVGISVTIPL